MLLTPAFRKVTAAQDVPQESGHWWAPTAGEPKDIGKLSELLNMKKVYVTTSFTDSRTISEPSPTRSGDIHRMVLDAIAVHKEMHVVPVPSQADFAILVRATASTESGDRPPNLSLALDPSTVVAVEVMVLVPGSVQSDRTVRPRVVWESSIPDAQVEAQSAARSTVDGFLWELEKSKDRAKAKVKSN
jgi:hypothetical protein